MKKILFNFLLVTLVAISSTSFAQQCNGISYPLEINGVKIADVCLSTLVVSESPVKVVDIFYEITFMPGYEIESSSSLSNILTPSMRSELFKYFDVSTTSYDTQDPGNFNIYTAISYQLEAFDADNDFTLAGALLATDNCANSISSPITGPAIVEDLALGAGSCYLNALATNVDPFIGWEELLSEAYKAPVIADIADISVGTDEGQCSASVAFNTTAADIVDGDITPVYSLADGTVITSPYVFPTGATIVNVNATDAAGNQAETKTFTVTVTDDEPPVLVVQDITLTLDANGYADTDKFTNGALVSFSDNCRVERMSSYAPGFYNCDNLGTFTELVEVFDENGNKTIATYQVTLTDPDFVCNTPPQGNVANAFITADETCTGTAPASIFDNGSFDADGDPLTFTAIPAAPYPLGETDVTVLVSDGKESVSLIAKIRVSDLTAPIAPTLDPIAAECSVTLTPPTAEDACDGTIIGTTNEPLTYDEPGTFTVTWTFTDNGFDYADEIFDRKPNVSTATQTVTIEDNTPPVLVMQDVNLEIGPDGTANGNPFSNGALVSLSDNCEAIGTINITGSKVYTCDNVGTFTVTAFTYDVSGNETRATYQVTLTDPNSVCNQPPVAVAQPLVLSATANCTADAAATDFDGGSTDPDGDVLSFEVSPVGPYPLGVTPVTLTVTDSKGASSTATTTVTVKNNAPVIGSITAPDGPQLLGSESVLLINYSDNEDNLASATIYWGDGNTSEADISAGSVSSSNIYSAPGVYEVSITLEDACGLKTEKTYQYIVIYDPSGGFVTGGGWIISPEGAHPPDPGLTGRAFFGFVSKYQKGAQVPTGKTDFEFKAADLRFRSISYEWLVVAGTRAKFKGEGTINGMGIYGFMLTATDSEDGDLFRIKIWDKATGAPMYDNQGKAADDSYAGTRIIGGSIVVHDGKGGKNARTDGNRKLAFGAESELGAEPGNFSFSYRAYPNPVLDELYLNISSESAEELSIRVYDIVGRLVHDSQHSMQAGDNQIQLNTTDWKVAKGKLIFQLESPSQGVQNMPLLKQ